MKKRKARRLTTDGLRMYSLKTSPADMEKVRRLAAAEQTTASAWIRKAIAQRINRELRATDGGEGATA